MSTQTIHIHAEFCAPYAQSEPGKPRHSFDTVGILERSEDSSEIVCLLGLSEDGVGILAKKRVEVGTRLTFEFRRQSTGERFRLTATVTTVRLIQPGWLIGCRFTTCLESITVQRLLGNGDASNGTVLAPENSYYDDSRYRNFTAERVAKLDCLV